MDTRLTQPSWMQQRFVPPPKRYHIKSREMQPPNDTVTEAIEAWNRRFVVPHVKVQRRDPDPFLVGSRLGSGGVGEVYECKIGGVPVALKRIYTKYHTEAVFAEVSIMRQMVEKRHRHIVQLIGSYEKRHSNSFELGLLIWPVAICDLAVLLHDVDIVRSWASYGETLGQLTIHHEEDVIYAFETLLKFESKTLPPDIIKNSNQECLELCTNTFLRLQSSIGCIANAVEWLHNSHIRHKDLKPSQILISASGLWLSDFGWSKDVSEMTCSTTVGGKTTTPKYLAPERALNQPCGRPEDIFSLGCIFLEIGYQLFRPTLSFDYDRGPPWFESGWLFSTHVEDAVSLAQYMMRHAPQASWFMPLVVRMLDRNPAGRPLIAEVVASLATQPAYSNHCCRPTTPRSLNNRSEALAESVKSSISKLVDHQQSPRTRPLRCGISLPASHWTHQPSKNHGSASGDQGASREFNWAYVTGQKRPLTQASPDHMSNLLPRKRMESDLFSPYHCDFPILPPVRATSSEEKYIQSKQPSEEYTVSHFPSLPEYPPLLSLKELLHLREGEPNSVSPNIACTLAPIEARTESPHRLSGHFPQTGSGSLPEHREPQSPDFLPDKSSDTTTEAFFQLSPDPSDPNSWQLPYSLDPNVWLLPYSSLPQSSVQSKAPWEAEKQPISPLWPARPAWACHEYTSNLVVSLHDKAEDQGMENQGPDASTPIASKSRSPSKDKPSFAPSAYTRERPWKEPEQVNHACVHCRRSHMTCDGEQPCTRCITRNIEHLCRYESPTGMKKAKSDTENSIAQTH
jgi:serine/threonine protein kinase